MFDMDFPDESFDISWSEGSVYATGFERGLLEWKQFLKSGGFMVIHDEQGNVEEKLVRIYNCDYELLGYFILDKEIWWTESRARYTDDPKIPEEIHQAQEELDMFKDNPEGNSSVCFIIRRN